MAPYFMVIPGKSINMPITNQEILERANVAITTGNYEAFLNYCTEDTEWEFVGEQTLRGKNAVRQYTAKTYLEPPTFKVEQFISDGEWLTAIGKIRLKQENGQWINYAYCDVCGNCAMVSWRH